MVETGIRDKRRSNGGKRKSVEKYKELVTNKEKLFDIFENNKVKRAKEEIDWGVQMGRMEEIYLEDMKSARKMTCGGGVDSVWFYGVMKKRRFTERQETSKAELATKFELVPIYEVEKMFDDEGGEG